MNEHAQFFIDGQVFSCDSSMCLSGNFEVKSQPRSYHVSWDDQENPVAAVNALMAENAANILLIDAAVFSLYRAQLMVSPEQVIAVTATEHFKTLDGVNQVFDFLYQRGFTKSATFIVVGGGIVQDVGAFTAACYKRGIQWVYFPTTLLAMCDSCVGAKSGINYKDAKNQMALFSAPTRVVMNPHFLHSLKEQDIKSGLGEILKLCITGGEPFLTAYQQYVSDGKVKDFASYKPLILMALSIKRAIIEVDEFEQHHRKGLNYGHTLGHAIEAMSDYAIPHGVAVTIGMMLSNELSTQHQLLPLTAKSRLNRLCRELLDADSLQLVSSLRIDKMLSLLKQDKKAAGDHISFVMMQQPGDIKFVKLMLNDDLRVTLGKILKQSFF